MRRFVGTGIAFFPERYCPVRELPARRTCFGVPSAVISTRVKPGQPVTVTVDTFTRQPLHGRVERIAPASGSQFALLPPDNATGNFTKVVQRIPVRIALDDGQPLLERLLPGMSVVTSIDTGDGGK